MPTRSTQTVAQYVTGQQEQLVTDNWMGLPLQACVAIPDELYFLSTIDQLLVKQSVEMWEVFLDWEKSKQYIVKNNCGETLYHAIEDSNYWLTRMCCGPTRSFNMKILDVYRREVIFFKSPLACGYWGSCCFSCRMKILEVYMNGGKLIGTVEERWSLFAPKYNIKNECSDTVLRVEGPTCVRCWSVIDFNVLSVDKPVQVGKITKAWNGCTSEWFINANYFGISFPVDLDVRLKAVLLGACFLIDFMYYETKPRSNVSRQCHFLA